mgnify:CR=1 FL=1
MLLSNAAITLTFVVIITPTKYLLAELEEEAVPGFLGPFEPTIQVGRKSLPPACWPDCQPALLRRTSGAMEMPNQTKPETDPDIFQEEESSGGKILVSYYKKYTF